MHAEQHEHILSMGLSVYMLVCVWSQKLLLPELLLSVDRCLCYAVGTLAASPCLYTSVPVCVGSREDVEP